MWKNIHILKPPSSNMTTHLKGEKFDDLPSNFFSVFSLSTWTFSVLRIFFGLFFLSEPLFLLVHHFVQEVGLLYHIQAVLKILIFRLHENCTNLASQGNYTVQEIILLLIFFFIFLIRSQWLKLSLITGRSKIFLLLNWALELSRYRRMKISQASTP